MGEAREWKSGTFFKARSSCSVKNGLAKSPLVLSDSW